MKYLVTAFGYDAGSDKRNIATKEEAVQIMERKVKQWCQKHDLDIDETDFVEGDTYFRYGIEEDGACIYEVHEVPDFKDEIDELLWKAQLALDYAEYAAEDYSYSLMDNCVSTYTTEVKDILSKIKTLREKR